MTINGPLDTSAAPGLQPENLLPEFQEIKDIVQDFLTRSPLLTTLKDEDLPPNIGSTGGGDNIPELDPPALNVEDMSRILMEIQIKLQDQNLKTSKEDIKLKMDKKQDLHQKRLEKLKDAMEKMAKAKKAGLFGKIFGWVATVASVVAAVALICTGVGAVAGGLLLAGAVLSTVSMISAETGNWLNKGLASAIEKIFHTSHDKAMMIAQITVAATIAALGLAGGIMALKSIASAAAELSAIGTKLLTASTLTEGIATIGQGSASIAASVSSYQAQMDQADSKEFQAYMKRLQMMIEDEMKRIKEILDQMQEGIQTVMEILQGQLDTKAFIIKQQGV